MDAKKQGKHVEDLSTAALGRRYLTPGDVKQDKGDDKGTTSRRSPERVRMHQAAMAIVERFRQHGDARVATQMIDSIEKQEDKDALRAWFLCFGGMVGDKKTGGFRKNRASAPDLKGGAAKPYWKFKPPAPRRPFDLDVELSALVSKARKLKRQPVEGDRIQDVLLDGLVRLLREHGV